MKQSYLLSEKNEEKVFAVIQDLDSEKIGEGYSDLINKVGLAIEEEFCYEDRVKIVHGSIINTDRFGTPCIYMEFLCNDEIDEEEIRQVVLIPITIY